MDIHGITRPRTILHGLYVSTTSVRKHIYMLPASTSRLKCIKRKLPPTEKNTTRAIEAQRLIQPADPDELMDPPALP
jgi:hypothetical protein